LGIHQTVLEFLAQGPSDYNTLLVPLNDDAETMPRLIQSYFRKSLSWDRLTLREVPEGSPLFSGFAPAGVEWYGTQRPKFERCPYAVLPSKWEDYYSRLGEGLRKDIRYFNNKLAKDHDVSFLIINHPTDGDLEDLFRLHGLRMAMTGRRSLLVTEPIVHFHKAFVRVASPKNRIRLQLLKSGGQTIAAQYGFVYKNRYSFYNSGFHPDFDGYSLGTLMIANAVRMCIREGVQEFDFLRGSEPYKLRWAQKYRVTRIKQLVNAKPLSLMKEAIRMAEAMAKTISQKVPASIPERR
jgi:CelD/BcsL family acetyltransferase involved in cellulose biosynthesis